MFADALQRLDMATLVLHHDLPESYELACSLAASVRRHGYSDRAGIRKAIDECALSSFNFVGEALNLTRDVVEETPVTIQHD